MAVYTSNLPVSVCLCHHLLVCSSNIPDPLTVTEELRDALKAVIDSYGLSE